MDRQGPNKMEYNAPSEKQTYYQSKTKRCKKFTSSAVGRSLGSNANILSNKRSARGSAFGNFWEKGIGFFFRMLLKYLRAFSLRTCWYNTNASAKNYIDNDMKQRQWMIKENKDSEP